MQSAQSTPVTAAVPTFIASDEPLATQIEIYFSEPLTASLAGERANYTVSGMTLSGTPLSRTTIPR